MRALDQLANRERTHAETKLWNLYARAALDHFMHICRCAVPSLIADTQHIWATVVDIGKCAVGLS